MLSAVSCKRYRHPGPQIDATFLRPLHPLQIARRTSAIQSSTESTPACVRKPRHCLILHTHLSAAHTGTASGPPHRSWSRSSGPPRRLPMQALRPRIKNDSSAFGGDHNTDMQPSNLEPDRHSDPWLLETKRLTFVMLTFTIPAAPELAQAVQRRDFFYKRKFSFFLNLSLDLRPPCSALHIS